jgi:hypothetical protein
LTSYLRIFVRPIRGWATGAARDRLAAVDDALNAYGSGRADGLAGRRDDALADDARSRADYLVGLVDGQVAAFEVALVTAVRAALRMAGEDDG